MNIEIIRKFIYSFFRHCCLRAFVINS